MVEIDGGGWSVSRPGPFNAPSTHRIGSRAILDAVAKRKVCPFRDSNPCRAAKHLIIKSKLQCRWNWPSKSSQVIKLIWLVFGMSSVPISTRALTVLRLQCFPQYFQVNARIVHWNRPRLFLPNPFKFSECEHRILFDTETASLNNVQ
jgi:hypothetical protein